MRRMGSGGTAPSIQNLCTGWSASIPDGFTQEYPLAAPQKGSAHGGRQKYTCRSHVVLPVACWYLSMLLNKYCSS
jgi:hypothetical protein